MHGLNQDRKQMLSLAVIRSDKYNKKARRSIIGLLALF